MTWRAERERLASALRRGCPRCRGWIVPDPAAVDLAVLDNAVTLAARADLTTMGVARAYGPRRVPHGLVGLLREETRNG